MSTPAASTRVRENTIAMFNLNEPLQRDEYRRVAFLWLVILFAWPPLVTLLAPGVTMGTEFITFALLSAPMVLSLLAIVILSMWWVC